MPLNQRGEVGEINQISNVEDKDGQSASPASDERLESVREQGQNGTLDQLEYTTDGTDAEPLPSNPVPDGHAVMIQGRQDNSGTVYVGDADVQAHALGSREAVEMQVKDTDEIHVQTPTGGDGVVLTWVTL